MKLREMEIFRAIMLGGSVSEAARILNVSQPAVSTSLRYMEDRLGMKLFRREKGRVYSTPEALALFTEIEGVFEKLDAVQRFAEDLRDTRSGVLSLASTPTLTYAFLAEAIAQFRRDRPGVRVSCWRSRTPSGRSNWRRPGRSTSGSSTRRPRTLCCGSRNWRPRRSSASCRRTTPWPARPLSGRRMSASIP